MGIIRVVFGWNSFLIKSYRPAELGLTNDSNPGYTLELRQRYFHIIWMPFLGIGKKWYLRKEGKLYEIPAAFKNVLDPYTNKAKGPWYTYSGIIIILVFSIWHLAKDTIRDHQHYLGEITWIAQKAEKVNDPETNDQYTLVADDGRFVMKVDSVKGDSILFSVPEVEDKTNSYRHNSFYESSNLISVWLTKETLLNCCAKTPEDFEHFKGQVIGNLNFLSTEQFLLDRIDR